MNRFLRFAVVGGVGFIVDVGVLALLLRWRFDPFSARIAAIAAALFVTWQLNRRLTFAPSGRSLRAEGARYGGVGLATAGVNYAVYTGLLVIVPTMHPLVALTLASASATLLSFAGYSKLVFNR